ncbi:MAG TPA: tetratricopeptide repeat protein [Luteibaculaceae bacterium]|nr:tetratricopeptide repeat protein [Luteibaculaceae bacterium]
METRKVAALSIMCLLGLAVSAQSTKKTIAEGNKSFQAKAYKGAEKQYQQALKGNKLQDISSYNLGEALYRQEKYNEAAQAFLQSAQKTSDPSLKANSLHNLGNALLQQKQYEEAAKAYQYSLMVNPTDENTRYNLAYAMQMLKKQQNPQQQPKNKPKQDEQQQQQQQQQQEQQDQQQQQNQQNKQNAENMLNALDQAEKQIQKKVKDQKGKPKQKTTDKDW